MKPEPVAWLTTDLDRVVTAKTYNGLVWDGGAAKTSMKVYVVPAYPASALQEARRAALEKAAMVCDDMRTDWAAMHGNPTSNAFDGGYTTALLAAAAAIRALIDKENRHE